MQVFTWGHGNTGALGHGSVNEESMPKLVSFFGPDATRDTDVHMSDGDPSKDRLATGVACGAWHTLVVTASGRVFAFGDGFTGQLGASFTDRMREGGQGRSYTER